MTSIVINEQGGMRFVWNDDLSGLRTLGTTSIRRASRVEADENGRFWAILEPVGGPTLGPFDLYGDAVAAEIDWIENNALDEEAATTVGAISG